MRVSVAPYDPVMAEFDAVGVIASDLAKTVAFYRSLGGELTFEADGHVEFTYASGFRLMIDSVATIESFSTFEPAEGGRNVGLAFVCASPAEVDELHATVVAAGHPSRVAPFDAPWGQRYATVLDPDDNPVDLFAALG
jgi:catechol 2,3-dioxygenase-like lactoylglutathione lyase family enzyme